jgi:hypothetical protein
MNYVGQPLYGYSGRHLGTVTDVMPDPIRLTPEWVTVRRGLLRREHLIPASAIDERDGVLVTLLDEEAVKHAPITHDHVPPTAEQSERIRAQFGLPIEVHEVGRRADDDTMESMVRPAISSDPVDDWPPPRPH